MNNKSLSLTSLKQRQGSQFERKALNYLQAQGLTLVTQNWCQPKVGELDLVMMQSGQYWNVLVFVEVRQRYRSDYGDAIASVTKVKQRKLIKTAQYFLQAYPDYADCECRFDIVAYDGEYDDGNNMPQWVVGAFVAQAW
ncbi:YraN family protein [Psychrobacter sp. I-STPA6b]|uniref:YraN family protein n=1 Tax=Psychrobacter sp. I-STPA6b TaxID=2585718 RepID=UPI001D0CB510|nr:YraN family protein [Psychrobacter sp. I-STPA6b]